MKKIKAQFNLGNLSSIIIALVVATVTIGILATILVNIQDQFLDTSTTYPNQTFTFANNSEQGLVSPRVDTGSIVCFNDSATKINIGTNYTVTAHSITFLNSSLSEWCHSTSCINCTYTYSIGSHARNTTEFGLTGMTTMAGFIPTIAIIAVAAIVIGMVLVMFGRRRQ